MITVLKGEIMNKFTVNNKTYNAKEFVERWIAEHGPMCVEKVRQGRQTESVPLGELKNLSEQRVLLFDEDAKLSCTMNLGIGENLPEESSNGVVALSNVIVAYKVVGVYSSL